MYSFYSNYNDSTLFTDDQILLLYMISSNKVAINITNTTGSTVRNDLILHDSQE